jgi:hypothetical protein
MRRTFPKLRRRSVINGQPASARWRGDQPALGWLLRKQRQRRSLAPEPAPGRDALISWWALEEDAGNLRMDSHGSNHLIASGNMSRLPGKQGFGADFGSYHSGTGSLHQNPPSTSTAWLNSVRAMSLWARVNEPFDLVGILHSYPFLLIGTSPYPYSGLSSDAIWVHVLFNETGVWQVASSGYVVGELHRMVMAIPRNEWFFIAFAFEDAHTVAVHINDARETFTRPDRIVLNGRPELSFFLGDEEGMSEGGVQMDEMAAWNRPLSEQELAWLYNSGAGRACAELNS